MLGLYSYRYNMHQKTRMHVRKMRRKTTLFDGIYSLKVIEGHQLWDVCLFLVLVSSQLPVQRDYGNLGVRLGVL